MKKSALLFFAILLSASLNAQNLLPEMWKFKTGDDPNGPPLLSMIRIGQILKPGYNGNRRALTDMTAMRGTG